jgi:hypothetical protein
MKDGLYNRKAYGLPAGAAEVFVAPAVDLDYAAHAYAESKADRYGVAELPGSIEVIAGDVVEVEVRGERPVKAVIRFPYDDNLDLVLVLIVLSNRRSFFVKTVWFNQASDNHRTLRLAPYSRP